MAQHQDFYTWFWDESIWLPKITSWERIKANRLPVIESLGGLYLCVPVAIGMMILRFAFESIIAKPFVIWLGVKGKGPVSVVPNAVCEKAFKACKHPKAEKVEELSNHLEWSKRQVERWFRQRRIMEQSTVLKKAKECSWRFLFYCSATIYGTIILYNQGCLYDLKLCFIDYKNHVMGIDLYIYFMAEIGMYISLSVSQFTDVKRKDFWQNMIHHLATLVLLTYSYIGGYFNIGALIVYIHDISDVFLEAAKVFHYAKRQRICDVSFVVFAIVFYISRLIVLPFRVYVSCVSDHDYYVGSFFVYKTMLGFLFLLQVLHMYWAYCISKIVYQALTGKGVTDTRSDGEDSSEPEQHTTDVLIESKKVL